MNELWPSFVDEFKKIAKTKFKLSGEETVDADNASRTLEQTTQTPPRGPHPALNLEAGLDKTAISAGHR